MAKSRIETSIFGKAKEAITCLLKTKTFDDVNVKDICAQAGFSRQYFYRYYLDKFDLAGDILIDCLSRGIGAVCSLGNSSAAILAELRKDAAFWKDVFSSSYIKEAYALFHGAGQILAHTLSDRRFDAQEEALLDLYLHGITVTLAGFFTRGEKIPEKKTATLFTDALPARLAFLQECEADGETVRHKLSQLEESRRKTREITF